MDTLPRMTCRKCQKVNPWVYYEPVVIPGDTAGTCICFDCAVSRQWVDPQSGKIRPGYQI